MTWFQYITQVLSSASWRTDVKAATHRLGGQQQSQTKSFGICCVCGCRPSSRWFCCSTLLHTHSCAGLYCTDQPPWCLIISNQSPLNSAVSNLPEVFSLVLQDPRVLLSSGGHEDYQPSFTDRVSFVLIWHWSEARTLNTINLALVRD